MATATANRTIIKTDTPGWFIDPSNGDKKVRKQDGDNIVTRAEYDQIVLDADPARDTAPRDQADEAAVTSGGVIVEPADKPSTDRTPTGKPDAPVTALTTGKVAIGKTVEIRCAWVDPEKRTEAQAALFESGFEGVEKGKTYEAVKAAAGNKRSAFPDGTKRVLKPQDLFQVRFAPENQDKWRAEQRRRKNKARREAAKAAAAAA